jgi:excisionase family DNA binding protein
MTTSELRALAKMVAQEYYKLQQKNHLIKDTYLNTKQAAEMLGWSVRTLYNKADEIPHVKVGKSLRFSERRLREYIERT